MLEKELQNAGLSERESKIYLACLEVGEASVANLAKKTDTKRTTVYLLVGSLQEKGLIGMVKRGKKTLYVAEDPRKIAEKMEQKKIAIERIVPELMSMASHSEKKPKIKYFEGRRAVEEVYLDTLFYPDQEVLAWFPAELTEQDKEFFNNFYIKKRLKNKIWIRAIASKTSDMQDYFKRDDSELRKTKLVSRDMLDLEVGIILYGKRKVGIISYNEGMGLVVEGEKIYRSLRNIFELVWNIFPENKDVGIKSRETSS
ncbi:MAG: helix-turn-helix domain-containing protein [Leadbetterella sp.]|nr:helix-turn-helix domain-containing protein [Leadbetterella sp.]